ncbi:uncharacterized protein LOC134790211 [Cydia splendana]|uniref:uncharacterized protein LOC134790211 n=1 Tax=Cydia splendana TaxID=1100963 RepID=UPI0028F4B74E
MVLTDFLTETRRRWLKAFKLFKRSKSRKSARNRISPLVRSPSYSGTVDARSEIDIQRYCPCRASLPPLHIASESIDGYSSCNSYDSSRNESLRSYECGYNCARSDSAYESARSSPARAPVCYATVTYFNVNDSEDSSSIRTEYTLLDYDLEDREMDGTEERAQNFINESLELVSTL